MYSFEDRMKAVQLFMKYDCSPTAVIHELGYPSRGMLYNWIKEYQETGSLRSDDMLGNVKYSKEQRKQAVEYYLGHGQSVSRTIRALGFPGRTVLREWLDEDIPSDTRIQRCKSNNCLVKCTPEQKEQAVIDYCAGSKSSKDIAKAYGISPNTIYGWKSVYGNLKLGQLGHWKLGHIQINVLSYQQRAEGGREECDQFESEAKDHTGSLEWHQQPANCIQDAYEQRYHKQICERV